MASAVAISWFDRPAATSRSTSTLAPGQRASAAGAGPGGDAERPQQRPGRVGVAGRLEPLEGHEGRPGLSHRDLGDLLGQGPGQLQAGAGQLHRQLGLGEPGQRLMQQAAGSPRPLATPTRPPANAATARRYGPRWARATGDGLAAQVQRLTQALQDLPRLALGQGGLEHPTGSRDVAATQGRQALLDQAELTHR